MRKRRRRSPAVAAIVLPLLLIAGAVAGYYYPLWLHRTNKPSPPPVKVAPPPPAQTAPPMVDNSGYTDLSIRSLDRRIPVLMFHDVIKKRGPASVWFDCTVDELQEQLDFFKEQGAQPISLQDLYDHLTQGKAVPENAIVLTFDDNYQGFFDNAYPLLKQYNYPSAMFVHTNYVGDKTGDHPKMDWETLKKLDKEGLVTIGSHTLSHPDDIRLLSPDKQEEELSRSKAILEEHLGHPIPFFAYPDGKNDQTTREIAKRVGYTMAFTVDNGMAEESPGIFAVHRYIHTRYKKAWEDRTKALAGAPAAFVDKPLQTSPVTLDIKEYDGVKLGLVKGGTPTTRRAAERQGVGFFVRDVQGVAGINGTFFADARLAGISNILIGPSQTGQEGTFVPEEDAYRLSVVQNRPIVIWGPTRIGIFPFQSGYMNTPDAFRAFMPDFTDMFLAGAWIVHSGVARSMEDMEIYGVHDAHDPRRRAFFGITETGEVVLGATLDVVPTARMAEAAVAAGVTEAVLLDSGFSTSLVYDNKIVVTGHTAANITSRPVPHAIVLTGTLSPITDPDVQQFLQTANSALEPAHDESYYQPHRRRRRRRRHVASQTGTSSAGHA